MRELEALAVEANAYASGSESGTVTLRRLDGHTLRLFWKCQDERAEAWVDLAYEAEVYRHVLAPLAVPVARFYGFTVDAAGRRWLFLEHLEGAQPITETDDFEGAMLRAAAWLGRFHATAGPQPFLRRYEARDGDRAVIHGDFFLHNLLVRDGEIYPVDWEHAGIGSPLVDLRCLLEAAGEDLAHPVRQAYVHARFGKGAA